MLCVSSGLRQGWTHYAVAGVCFKVHMNALVTRRARIGAVLVFMLTAVQYCYNYELRTNCM